jgi:hypothetical protein
MKRWKRLIAWNIFGNGCLKKKPKRQGSKMKTITEEQPKIGRIKPETVARKLAAIRNRENLPALKQIEAQPRLVEMLWYLQAMSLQPGGLYKFTEDMVTANPGQVGTKTMRAAKSRNYTAAQKLEISRELKSEHQPCVEGEKSLSGFDHMIMSREEVERLESQNDTARSKVLRDWNAEDFEMRCSSGALETIPQFLFEVCTDTKIDFSKGESLDQKERAWKWCFGDVVEAVFEMMDRTASEAKKQIAMTEVSKRVFQEMDYALQEKVMVRIEGESGFGKTESLDAWCNMRPGAARLVRVPASNSMKDFMIAIGKALGIECSFGMSTTGLREKIDYVLEHSGLTIVFDECAFLIPRSYVHTSSPARLEWVRDKIIDRGLPVVLASTPTKWKSDVARFQKKTNYTLEEFFRRNFLTVVLPKALSESDMIEAARIHFPQLDPNQLGFIASQARLSTNYLAAVDSISRRVRYLAKGRRITFALIEQATAEYFGKPQSQTSKEPVASPLNTVSRAVNPASKPRGGSDFQRCSLRGTVSEKAEVELISADS